MRKEIYYIFALALFSVSFYSTAYGQSHEMPRFIFPAGCRYGHDCWAVNYVDVDPEEGVYLDFLCNAKTYDGHKGTDFALGSVAWMRAGVDVLAAAQGEVLRVRDGESDSLKNAKALEAVRQSNKECGNGVLIDHGGGVQTMYCHLKSGSVVVQRGQRVRAGEKIAQIGQSGYAEFPHLHFGVFSGGEVIDPYTGAPSRQGCGVMEEPLWHVGLPMVYEPVVIFGGGFRSQPPDFKAIERGDNENPETLSLRSAALVFWAGFFNVEAGDEFLLEVFDPDGEVFVSREQKAQKNRARQYYYTGRKVGKVQLKEGIYKGVVTLKRRGDDGVFLEREKVFRVAME